MKHKLLLPLLIFGIVASGGFMLSSSVAHAQGASMYAPGHRYNFTFRLRSTDRYISNQNDVHQLLEDLIAYIHELQEMLNDLEETDSEVAVTTHSAISITDDSATLRGEVTDFNDSDYATVWFEYGRSSSVLTTRTSTQRLSDSSDGDFERDISGLRDDTRYYFRAIARDDRGRTDYGSVRNFITQESSPYDKPDVTTRSASYVNDNSAILHGSVDMNDFRNGIVFFIYGEDEDRIDEVEDEYDTYIDVDEWGEDLQKVLVDRDLDDDDTYAEMVSKLDSDTEHYFNLCVAYEDEDDDEALACGLTRSFTTDS